MYIKKIILTFSLSLFVTISFSNRKIEGSTDQISIFDIESQIKISIQTDLEHIIFNREIEKIPAKISVTINNIKQEFDAFVEVRGNFRRDSANCDFPPIRILFEGKEIEETTFAGHENIKIVTHCKKKSNQFLQFMAKEYTTYEIYKLLSPYSFKVKMVEITYIDAKNQTKSITSQAFLIEDINHLAEKHNMKEYIGKLSTENIDRENLLSLSVFQFMIGNTDWIIQLSKNIKSITDGEKIIAVPYDFDYTAIVDTDYSIGGGYSFLSTPKRMFKGPCYELSDLEAEFDRLRERKKDIINLISKSPYLKSGSKQSMKNYVNEFYTLIQSKEKVIEHFQFKCN